MWGPVAVTWASEQRKKNKVKKKIPATFMNARLLLVFVIMCDSESTAFLSIPREARVILLLLR